MGLFLLNVRKSILHSHDLQFLNFKKSITFVNPLTQIPTSKFGNLSLESLVWREFLSYEWYLVPLLLIEALSPLPNSSTLKVMCSDFRFIATTIFNSSDKATACLSDKSFNYLIVSSSLRCSCTLVPSSLHCSCTLIPFVKIDAKTMLWYQIL